MNVVNKIIFTRRDFKDADVLYKKVADQIRLLLESNHILLAFDADEQDGVIVIEYVHDDESSPRPYWLFANEAEAAKEQHEEVELENCRKRLNVKDNKIA